MATPAAGASRAFARLPSPGPQAFGARPLIKSDPMPEKSRNDHDATTANWILLAVLVGVAVALYAFVFMNPPTFGH